MKANPSIYCDYSASAPLRAEVRAATAEIDDHIIGNASSIHQPGQAARVALERARKTVARSIGAQPREIIFTSGGTEANNTVLWGLLKAGDHVVTSLIEHPSVQGPLKRLQEQGVTVTQVSPAATGEILVGEVAKAIRSNTRLITVMAVNNETGVVNDLTALGTLATEQGVLFHTDAVQALGKLPIDVARSGIHFLSASAHKLGGPKGVGLLYARQMIPFQPRQLGGSQENGHRGGTENVAGAVGFAKALELAVEEQETLYQRHSAFRKAFLRVLTEDQTSFSINGSGSCPGIINIHLPGIAGHALVMNLDAEGVAVSYGSACASGTPKPSHVLLAMGLDEEAASQSVRISFGYGTTEAEVHTVARILVRVVARMASSIPEATTEATGKVEASA